MMTNTKKENNLTSKTTKVEKKNIKEKMTKVRKKDIKEVEKTMKSNSKKGKVDKNKIVEDKGKKIVAEKKTGKGLKTSLLRLLNAISSRKFEDKEGNIIVPNFATENFVILDKENNQITYRNYYVVAYSLFGLKTALKNSIKKTGFEKKEVENLMNDFVKKWLDINELETAKEKAKTEENILNLIILDIIETKLKIDKGKKIDENKIDEINEQIEKFGLEKLFKGTIVGEIVKSLDDFKNKKKSEQIFDIVKKEKLKSNSYLIIMNKGPYTEKEIEEITEKNEITISKVAKNKMLSSDKEKDKPIIIQADKKEEIEENFITKIIDFLLGMESIDYSKENENEIKLKKIYELLIINKLLEEIKESSDSEEIEKKLKKIYKLYGTELTEIINKFKTVENNNKLEFLKDCTKKSYINKVDKDFYKEMLKSFIPDKIEYSDNKDVEYSIKVEDFIKNIPLGKYGAGTVTEITNNLKDLFFTISINTNKDNEPSKQYITNIYYTKYDDDENSYSISSEMINTLEYNINKYLNKNEVKIENLIQFVNVNDEIKNKFINSIKEVLESKNNKTKKEDIAEQIGQKIAEQIKEIEEPTSIITDDINESFQNRVKSLIILKSNKKKKKDDKYEYGLLTISQVSKLDINDYLPIYDYAIKKGEEIKKQINTKEENNNELSTFINLFIEASRDKKVSFLKNINEENNNKIIGVLSYTSYFLLILNLFFSGEIAFYVDIKTKTQKKNKTKNKEKTKIADVKTNGKKQDIKNLRKSVKK